MIHSDKQYHISARELAKLKDALEIARVDETHPEWLRMAQVDALESQIADLKAEITHYDLLKSRQISFGKSFDLKELPAVLVQARIAAGMSQTDLAKALGTKPQQVQRYEASEYMSASLTRLIEVSRVLNVRTTGLFENDEGRRGGVFSWNNADDIIWRQFPVRDMIERGWIRPPSGQDVVQSVKDYFQDVAGSELLTVLRRKKLRSDTLPNEYALLAWQVRVLERARNHVADWRLPEFRFDDRWLPELVSLTRDADGPCNAPSLLARKGIILVTERHLPGTCLDGAAMLDDAGRPVIGLTLRHDRLDDFWFVLLHELGHVFLHLMDGLRYDFFDESDTSESDDLELDADRFALSTLIPDASWDEFLSRFDDSEDALRIAAEELGVGESIIAGRIRKERGDDTIFRHWIGQGCVRYLFGEIGYGVDE